jgi:hypothetical protein
MIEAGPPVQEFLVLVERPTCPGCRMRMICVSDSPGLPDDRPHHECLRCGHVEQPNVEQPKPRPPRADRQAPPN